ncbi:Ribosomal protein L11 methyltransferase [hydrothermal vent metagenome]|uniref:Ribosomal protein L11 methyltransferase n=1 Tax=hydrothermal vent metagenome TaxID=652676 RepID=A0A3B1A1G5_9ZZZZ
MPWLQIKIDSDETHAEYFSDELMELGAAAVTFQDAADQEIFEPTLGTTPLWSATRIIGLFDANVDIEQITNSLKSKTFQQKDISANLKVEQLEDKDWIRTWMDDFKAIQFSKTLWLCPSWLEPPDIQATNILLDPGLAFGTGTHPTTAMCMQWLGTNTMPETVIDYGCGSGILGITAAKLGAKIVSAVDNDPQALIATQQNAKKNHIEDKITSFYPEQLPDNKANLLIANILAQPLIDLATLFNNLLAENGHLVISGILENQAKMLIDAYAPYLTLKIVNQQQEWTCLSGIKI